MANRMESYYLRIGSFAIMGIILVITGVLIIGAGKLFEKTIYVETYFDESIQGISVGSPVKYRGLQIGYVDQIKFVNEIYPEHRVNGNNAYNRYIYVLVAITNSILTASPARGMSSSIKKDIQDGLRFKLALQGLTGTAYLELNYIDPKKATDLPMDWKPIHYYIPSALSPLSLVSDNVQYILEELKRVDVKRLFDSIQELTDVTAHAVQKVDNLLGRSSQKIRSIVNNVQAITEDLKDVASQSKASPSSLLWSSPPPRLDPEKL